MKLVSLRWPRAVGVLAAGTLAVLGAWWLASPGADSAPAAASPASSAVAAGGRPAGANEISTPPAAAPDTLPSPAPDTSDRFLTPALRDRLEALLLAAGDAASPAALKAQAGALLPQHFAATDLARAQALLERYVDYRVALGAIAQPADPADPRALRQTIDARDAVRRRHFDAAEVDALFAQEDELDRFTLARLEVERNPSLSAAQKADSLRDAESDLAPATRAARADATAHVAVAAQTADFDARGASAHERHADRSARYGQAAAQRLAQVDGEEQDWQQRLGSYGAAQAAQADAAQLQRLRQTLFTPDEQLRIDAALALWAQQR